MLPRFEIVARRRPVRLVVPGTTLPPVAPYVAVQGTLTGPGRAEVTLASGEVTLTATLDGVVELLVTTGARTSRHRSRRFGRPEAAVEALAITLTGSQVTAMTRERGRWVARARLDLAERLDTHDESWLAGLSDSARGPVDDVQAGTFGQLGLRDARIVSHPDGTPYLTDGLVLLTASSAGPGFFPTGHTSVWALDPATYELDHRADLFFRRPDRAGVFGDHATHLVRHGDHWLAATCTWGDFDQRRKDASVAVTIAESRADLLTGEHVLDTRPLALPTIGLRSVAVWDPHLVHDDQGQWHVGYVNATRFFQFHPVVASGPGLDELSLRAAAVDRKATEGTTLVRLGEDWRVLASDSRHGRRGQRAAYPVFDLDLHELGAVDAAYPTNVPWPTLVRDPTSGRHAWLMVGFNGAGYGGALVGYGSHGAVVVQRTVAGL